MLIGWLAGGRLSPGLVLRHSNAWRNSARPSGVGPWLAVEQRDRDLEYGLRGRAGHDNLQLVPQHAAGDGFADVGSVRIRLCAVRAGREAIARSSRAVPCDRRHRSWCRGATDIGADPGDERFPKRTRGSARAPSPLRPLSFPARSRSTRALRRSGHSSSLVKPTSTCSAKRSGVSPAWMIARMRASTPARSGSGSPAIQLIDDMCASTRSGSADP